MGVTRAQLRPSAQLLARMLGDYLQDAGATFLAPKLCPLVSTDMESGTYFRDSIRSVLGEGQGANAPRDGSRAWGGLFDEMVHAPGSGSFELVAYGKQISIDNDQLKTNTAKGLGLIRRYSKILYHQMMLLWERRVAALAFASSGTWSTTNVAAAAGWNSTTTGTPLADLITANSRIVGGPANALVIGSIDWMYLARHPNFTGILKSSSSADEILDAERMGLALASVFGVPRFRVFVGGAQYNSADEGDTDAASRVWDDACLLLRMPMAAPQQLGDESPLVTLALDATAAAPVVADSYQHAPSNSTVLRARHSTDEIVTEPHSACLITNIYQ